MNVFLCSNYIKQALGMINTKFTIVGSGNKVKCNPRRCLKCMCNFFLKNKGKYEKMLRSDTAVWWIYEC